LKSVDGWYNNGNGEDTYGFAALPGGNGGSSGNFGNVGNDGNWWSSYENYSSSAYYRYTDYSYEDAIWFYGNNGKSYLYSVRCISDNPPPPTGR
jgi:uncharacterized protein (TIGR02145 family)